MFYRPDISDSITLNCFSGSPTLSLREKTQQFVENWVGQLRELQEENKKVVSEVYAHIKNSNGHFSCRWLIESVLDIKRLTNQEVKQTNNIQDSLNLLFSTLNNKRKDQPAQEKLHFTDNPSELCQTPLLYHVLWYFEQQKYCTDYLEHFLSAVIYLEDNDSILMAIEGLSLSYMLCILVYLLIGRFRHPVDRPFIIQSGQHFFTLVSTALETFAQTTIGGI